MVAINFIAVNNHVVVEALDKIEKTTASGIVIPTIVTDVEPQSYGKITSMGPDVSATCGLSVGDTVVFAKFGGQSIIIDGVRHVILKQGEIYCKLGDVA